MLKVNIEMKDILFEWVYVSSDNRSISQLSSNAMSILVVSGITMGGKELSEISKPNVILNGGIFGDCKLSIMLI